MATEELTAQITAIIPKDLLTYLDAEAAKQGRSRSNLVAYILEIYRKTQTELTQNNKQ